MSAYKWIGGLLGWVSGGPIGALIGVLFGSMIESGINSMKQISSGSSSSSGSGGSQNYSRQRDYRTRTRTVYTNDERRNSFMVSLLVLSSAVVRADGKMLQSELDYVKRFIVRNFGPLAEVEAMNILSELNKKEINIYSVGSQISANMNYSQRLQLYHYLAELANADGNVCGQEISVLQAIASAIGISGPDAQSVLAMFSKTDESAYKILEIDPSATDDEVKSAYRRLAMKNHPDKVASLGSDVQKAAADKFRKIQEAYETVKKERGL